MQDPKGQIQKKAYKILSVILKSSDGFVSKNLEELLELMHNICHVSAKRHKLDCLYFLLAYASKMDDLKARKNIVSSFLPEVILALKEVLKSRGLIDMQQEQPYSDITLKLMSGLFSNVQQ